MKTTKVIFLSAILIISVVFAEDQGKNVTTPAVHNSTLVMTKDSARLSRHFGGEDKKGGGGGGYGGGYGYGYGPPPPMPCCPCYGGGYPYYG